MLANNKLYLEDLDQITKVIPSLEKLKNKSVMITGACGMICSCIVDFLIYLNDKYQYNINVYAFVRPKDHVEVRFKSYIDRSDFHHVLYNALLDLETNEHFDYMIHGASNVSSESFMKEPVETMLANFVGLNNLLDYARFYKTERVLYISTSEVYGNKEEQSAYKEDDYEFLDILKTRACYPSSKRASETLAVSYSYEYDVDTVMVRPGHVYGPTMSPFDTRAASQFAKDVLDGHDIIMKSSGQQLRSHCYVVDCVSAILTVLLNGEKAKAYNISNKHSVSTIREIAEAYAKAGNRQVIFDLPTEEEKASYNMMSNSSLDSTLLESLGWKGVFDLETGTRHTINILNNQEE